ncbi:hypothetical protein ACYCJX_09810 [Staphylococcus borealis]|uniref:hypothetical protein n=1 Tax=Staphylococcus haemolyticus TaxID=1283 RepID=UPI000FF84D30|nr:hypothetical protein [Staphylococcus haemolyticus]MBU6948720.1 hypothetical protein [Staphylococcus haemolyticus]MBU7211551.1 hypothetical protein [Staphylococcus haemolyticus]RIO94464.1 hypothetical protein BUZ39_01090 [Staphylococcus haemolyticus]
MSKLINQEYVIETKDGNYYEEEIQVFGGDQSLSNALKVSPYVKGAKRFSDISEAHDVAYAYGFKVLTLNTYLEED